MKDQLTWEEVIKRDDIIGGTIKIYECNHVYRGKIRSLKIEGEQVFIDLDGAERALSLDENEKKHWKHSVVSSFFWKKICLATPVRDGPISFVISNLSFALIYPKGVDDPDFVKAKRLRA